MKIAAIFSVLVIVAVLAAGNARANGGEDLTVHNQTGHQTVVFVLQNDAADLDPDDGVQVAAIDNGGSAVAHVPHCYFGGTPGRSRRHLACRVSRLQFDRLHLHEQHRTRQTRSPPPRRPRPLISIGSIARHHKRSAFTE